MTCTLLENEVSQILERLNKAGEIILQTSGTTGVPKDVKIDIKAAFENKKGRGSNEERWLLTYSPQRWAGLSVILHTHKIAAKLIVPKSLMPQDIAECFKEITHVSLTPSLFRKLMLIDAASISNAPIKQLTFGGEYATQKILDDAKKLYPNAKITHVYASTELGDICASSDGFEGYPLYKIANNDGYINPDTQELFIKNKATDDLWEIKNERIYFLGRKSENINVGGAKISQTTIENAANKIDGVDQCKAYAIENALLGQVVGLDYVGAIEPITLKKQLLMMLPKYGVPVKINKVDEIILTSAGKIARK